MFSRVVASVSRRSIRPLFASSPATFSASSSLATSSHKFSSPSLSSSSSASSSLYFPVRSFLSSTPRLDDNQYKLTPAAPMKPSDYPVGYTGKQYTGMTGLDVIPNAKEVLIGLYEETIKIAKAYGSNNYNNHIVKLCEYRLRLVRENETNEQIEHAIAAGQIEELVEQAEDELDLLVTMNEEVKPWEADPADDAEFAATDYPMYGETEAMHDLKVDDSCWEEVDKQLGYGKDGKKLAPATPAQ